MALAYGSAPYRNRPHHGLQLVHRTSLPNGAYCPAKADSGPPASLGHREDHDGPEFPVREHCARGPGGLIYLVQQFEGDYVRYSKLPTIEEWVLTLAGRTVNGALIERDDDLGLQIYYSPPLRR